ncbi:MAG: carbohydrate kinase [Myxococcales bacterium]|jgi:fructokinase|nr:carbohydrate kinase [Myxococcales bacterium]
MADKIDCACFGEILWDIFDEGREPKEPIGKVFRRELGGAPANVAVGLARLGFSASVVGGVGEDRFGDALRSFLAAEKVETKHVLRLPNRTGITFVTRSEKGEPAFLFYRNDTADVAVTAEHVGAASAKATFGLVGSSTWMTPSLKEATIKFIDALEKAKGDLVVDLNVRSHMWNDDARMKKEIAELVGRAKLVKASEGDLAQLAGKRGLSWLEEHAKGATWLLTRGENGAAAVGAHGQVTAAPKRVRSVDATGAGDAFLAGAIGVLVTTGARAGNSAWKDPKVWTRVLEVGHMMGAKAVSAVGAVSGLVNLEEVRTKIASGSKK